ncbi:hypothetical protein K5X82_18930 [Halosquirtibacter xylanolyticus]|uniref:nucleoside recognition domain-containing protein n=1 Tax=Halosquirtibacter xylanolyticus TaxID=3374599 RepID=UPI003748C764|nr:hypothetical protein K5X82_18930 [Prolixibacteraceae bacterium]
MALNYIWILFFIIAFLWGCIQLLVYGDYQIFNEMIDALFLMAKTGFEVSLGLTGILSLWMGIMKIGESSGIIRSLSRIFSPVFSRLFPELGENHPVYGTIMMNLSANMLGLDNAATPLGLRAMKQMQVENKNKDIASNSQIMFLVLNTSGLTLIPISILVYRAQAGAVHPADVFIPILLSTFCSTLAGVIITGWKQKINFKDPVLLTALLGSIVVVAFIVYGFMQVPTEMMASYSSLIANLILFTIIILFLLNGARKKIHVYNVFIEGAKDGFKTAVTIIPYLIAILVAVGVFRASGVLDLCLNGIKELVLLGGYDDRFVDALPTALMKPLSGSGARGMMVECMDHYGADSFAGRLSSVFQGATDTTFYIIAVYFGSVGIKNSRYALPYGLFCDFIGIVAAIFISYMFFS